MKSLFQKWADYGIDSWFSGKVSMPARIVLAILLVLFLLIGMLIQYVGR